MPIVNVRVPAVANAALAAALVHGFFYSACLIRRPIPAGFFVTRRYPQIHTKAPDGRAMPLI